MKREYTEVCYPVTKEFRERLYGEIIKKNSELKSWEIGGEGLEKVREFGDESCRLDRKYNSGLIIYIYKKYCYE